jgi:hypothetical protein
VGACWLTVGGVKASGWLVCAGADEALTSRAGPVPLTGGGGRGCWRSARGRAEDWLASRAAASAAGSDTLRGRVRWSGRASAQALRKQALTMGPR